MRSAGAQGQHSWRSLGEAGGGDGASQIRGYGWLKEEVEVLENTENIKTSGNQCKRYRASVNICYLIAET